MMEKISVPIDSQADRALREAEERQEAMLAAIPDLVFRISTDGEYLDVHVPEGFEGLVVPGTRIGASVMDTLPQSVADEAMRACREVAESGIPQTIEYHLFLPDGQTFFEGRIVRSGRDEVVAIIRDVTRWVRAERERAHAEALLRESESRHRHLLNELPDGVYRSTPEGKLLEVNPAFVRMLGYDTKEEVLALDVATEIYVDGERDGVNRSQQVSSRVAVFRNRRKDGSVIWVEDHGSFVRDDDGRVIFHEGIIRDVTERIETAQALQESERRFRELFDQSKQLAGLVSTEGTLLAVNSEARRYLAEGQSAGIGQPFWDTAWWSHSEELQQQVREWVRLAAGGESTDFEALHPDGRGEMHMVSGSIGPLRDHEGEVEYIMLTAFDVTERWRLRQEILQIAEQERERLGRALHDGLGQQLTGLSLMARALERKLDARNAEEADQVRQFREIIQQALNQTRHLSRDLLPIPLEQGGLTEALEELAINTAQLFGLPIRANVDSSAHIDDSAAAMHLYQIARESVTNAARHANADHISIDLHVTPEATILSVIDNGIGMPDGLDLAEGIGVPTMRYRARQLGAELNMGPSVSGGTLVECILPRGGPAQ